MMCLRNADKRSGQDQSEMGAWTMIRQEFLIKQCQDLIQEITKDVGEGLWSL